jgi:hypothetical protein
MKIKIVAVCIIISLIITGINVIANQNEADEETLIFQLSDIFSFSEITFDSIIDEKNDYVSVSIKETDNYLNIADAPMLPVYIKTYTFPIGTIIKNIDLKIDNVKEQIISEKIIPAPRPVPLLSITKSNDENVESYEQETVYASSEIFPSTWSEYKLGAGLDKGERVIFLTIRVYPVRYSPQKDTIYSIDGFALDVTYEEGPLPFNPTEEVYDLVIITPRRLRLGVLPLKAHKEKMGVSTLVQTTEQIYRDYDGRDEAEKIKYFIKDSIETHDTKYVLLIGGRIHSSFRWFLPIRYSNLEDRGGWNETYVSDLYYSDIYKVDNQTHEIVFEDWDSNGNGIFAEWTWFWNPEWEWWSNDINKFDELDLYPDVYVGRLACVDILELRTVVRKIINYEKRSYDSSWFNKMIVVGGDTVPGDFQGVYEGEMENELAASYMEPKGFNVTRLWTSDGSFASANDLIKELNKGAGFLYLSGHGSPIIWSTHKPDSEEWVDILAITLKKVLNFYKLPVCLVGGCHNSQIDCGRATFISGILKNGLKYFTYDEYEQDGERFWKAAWPKICWSWSLVSNPKGGSIATIGNTGLGWGTAGYGCIEGLDGWINTRFFYNYAELMDLENCTLGMVHSQTINDYVENFNPNHKLNNLDRKTTEQWILLGDPSLKIGGYP